MVVSSETEEIQQRLTISPSVVVTFDYTKSRACDLKNCDLQRRTID